MKTYDDLVELDAVITQAGAGTTEVVPAQPNKKIRVVGYAFTLSAAGTAKFRSGAGTDKTGAMTLAANGGISSDSVPFVCVAGEALNIVSTVGAANGHITYQLVPA